MSVTLIGAAVVLVPAMLVSLAGHLKGYDPALFFVVGLFSSFIGILVVACLPDRIGEAESRSTAS